MLALPLRRKAENIIYLAIQTVAAVQTTRRTGMAGLLSRRTARATEPLGIVSVHRYPVICWAGRRPHPVRACKRSLPLAFPAPSGGAVARGGGPHDVKVNTYFAAPASAAARRRCGVRLRPRQQAPEDWDHDPHRRRVLADFQHPRRPPAPVDSDHGQRRRQVPGDFHGQPRQLGRGDSVLFYLS